MNKISEIMRWQTQEYKAEIPMRRVGPVHIESAELQGMVLLPLATLESPLWPSTHRGAKACNQAGGIRAVVVRESMARSLLLEGDSIHDINEAVHTLSSKIAAMQALVRKTSRYAELIEFHTQLVGSLLYLRLSFHT